MKKILCILFEILFILIFTYGFLCMLGEVEPWNMSSQIWLYVKGILFMLIGFFGCAFMEGREAV